MMRRGSGFTLVLLTAVVAVGLWDCGGQHSTTIPQGPSSATTARYPGATETPEQLAQLATPCTFVTDSGVVTVAMTGGEYALIGRSDGGTLLVNGLPCSTATTSNVTRINVNGSNDGGSETVILDYINGSFALGSSTSAGVNVDLKGGVDTLKIRGTSGADIFYIVTVAPDAGATGVYAVSMGLNGTSPTGIKNITFNNVESFVISSGPGDDSVRTNGSGDAGIGAIPFGRSTTDAGPTFTFYAGDDNDTLYMGALRGPVVNYSGGAGTDTIDLSLRTNDLFVSLGIDGGHCEAVETCTVQNDVEVILGGSGNDTFTCTDENDAGCTVYGGAGNDTITGSAYNDTLIGDAGNDTIIPREGDDIVDCGGGTDTISYADRWDGGALTIALGGDGGMANPGNGASAVSENDSIAYCENIIGGSGIDTINGNELNNIISGGPGNDVIYGGPGDDTFNMGSSAAANGKDMIDGEEGEDTIDFSARTVAVNVVLNTNSATYVNGEAAEDAGVVNVENVLTGSGNDTVAGDSANNRIETNDGNDTINGGAGDDIIAPGAGTNTIICGPGNDLVLQTAGATDSMDNTCEP